MANRVLAPGESATGGTSSTRRSGETTEIATLAAELNRLNAKRATLLRRIQAVVATMVADPLNGGVEARRSARGVRRRRRGGRPEGFKVSAATRAKLRAAWKKRKAGAGS